MTNTKQSRQLRLGFAGTPPFAATILHAMLQAGMSVAVVYTQPDRPKGRGRRAVDGAVKALAEGQGLMLRQPRSLKAPQAIDELRGFQLDMLVVAAYGLILPAAALSAPRLGCINVHASLLPRWRGAAPVERAIMAGDHETGVSIMQMDQGLDTGPLYAQRAWPIGPSTTGAELEAQLAREGASLLLDSLPEIGHNEPCPQSDAGITYAHKLTAADAKVDWQHDAPVIERRIRALCERLPATVTRGPVRIRLLQAALGAERAAGTQPGTIVRSDTAGIEVACGRGTLVLLRVQLSTGKARPMDAADARNGYPTLFAPGASLCDAP